MQSPLPCSRGPVSTARQNASVSLELPFPSLVPPPIFQLPPYAFTQSTVLYPPLPSSLAYWSLRRARGLCDSFVSSLLLFYRSRPLVSISPSLFSSYLSPPPAQAHFFSLFFLSLVAAPTTEPANFASATLLALQIVLGEASPAIETIHAARVGSSALAEVVPLVCRRSCSDYVSFEPVSFILPLSIIPASREQRERSERMDYKLAKLTQEGYDWVSFGASLACSGRPRSEFSPSTFLLMIISSLIHTFFSLSQSLWNHFLHGRADRSVCALSFRVSWTSCFQDCLRLRAPLTHPSPSFFASSHSRSDVSTASFLYVSSQLRADWKNLPSFFLDLKLTLFLLPRSPLLSGPQLLLLCPSPASPRAPSRPSNRPETKQTSTDARIVESQLNLLVRFSFPLEHNLCTFDASLTLSLSLSFSCPTAVLQNACTQSTTLVAPHNHLLPYEAVGTDASGATTLSLSLASSYASSSSKRIGSPASWSSLVIGLLVLGGGVLTGSGLAGS